MGDSLSVHFLRLDKVMVDETSNSFIIQKCIDKVEFASVGCTEFHSKD